MLILFKIEDFENSNNQNRFAILYEIVRKDLINCGVTKSKTGIDPHLNKHNLQKLPENKEHFIT